MKDSAEKIVKAAAKCMIQVDYHSDGRKPSHSVCNYKDDAYRVIIRARKHLAAKRRKGSK